MRGPAQGLDPLNGFEPMAWKSVKPDSPREVGGSPLKYDVPVEHAKRVYVPIIPVTIAHKIWMRHNRTCAERDIISDHSFRILAAALRKGDLAAFWKWFKKNPIPLFITEGAKKAGCLSSLGFLAISVEGMFDFCVPAKKDLLGKKIKGPDILKPEIEALVEGRSVFVVTDEDTKLKTVKMGSIARSKAVKGLLRAGANPFIVRWNPEDGKGIDDLYHNKGAEAVCAAVEKAEDISNAIVKRTIGKQLDRCPDLLINQKELSLSLDTIEGQKLVIMISAKGTGKTQNFLSKIAQRAKKVLNIGHLINLSRSSAANLDSRYRDELEKGYGYFFDPITNEVINKISTVVNSLLAFNPKDYVGATIILDEGTQMIRALLTSPLIGEKGLRPALLNRFRQLIENAEQVVLCDADADEETIKYLEALMEGVKAFVIKNEFKPAGFDVTFYENKNYSAIARDAIDRYTEEFNKGASGGHVFVSCDSMSVVKSIAKVIRDSVEKAVIYEIHSDSSDGELEKAFAAEPDTWLSYQEGHEPCFVIFSPSLGTGTSITGSRVAAVYGIFSGGSILDTDVLQMLNRVRNKAPRFIWARESGNAYSKVSSTMKPETIKDELKNSSDLIASVLKAEITEPCYDAIKGISWEEDPHIEMFCQLEAKRNQSMPQFRQRVQARLENENNQITDRVWENDEETQKKLLANREHIRAEEAATVAAKPDITNKEAAELSEKGDKKGLTFDERQILAKHNLANFYCQIVTAELILADKSGQRRRQIRAFEELYDRNLAIKRDKSNIEQQAIWGLGVSPQDLKKRTVASIGRNTIGLKDWIERTDEWTNKSPELANFKLGSLQNATHFKRVFNLTVKEEMSGQQILSTLLAQVGVKVIHEQRRVDGKKVRFYRIDQEALAEQMAIVALREQKREAEAQQDFQGGTPPSLETPHPC